jgi:hypothetical protein
MRRGKFRVPDENKDKETKCFNSFDCNQKPLELLRFQCIKICINIHFEERKKAEPFLLIVIETVSFGELIQSNPEIPNSVTTVL